MIPAMSGHESFQQAGLALIGQIESALQQSKQRLDEEIKSYPRPITACDVQFDHALEEQARIRQALTRAETLFTDHSRHDDFVRAVGEFIDTCPDLTAESKRQLKSSLALLAEPV
jgi:hypothetical protein